MTDRRSGGVNIKKSNVESGGDIIGRDKVVHTPSPHKKDIRSIIASSFWNALALVGMIILVPLALISASSGEAAGIFGAIILSVICWWLYKIYKKTQ